MLVLFFFTFSCSYSCKVSQFSLHDFCNFLRFFCTEFLYVFSTFYNFAIIESMLFLKHRPPSGQKTRPRGLAIIIFLPKPRTYPSPSKHTQSHANQPKSSPPHIGFVQRSRMSKLSREDNIQYQRWYDQKWCQGEYLALECLTPVISFETTWKSRKWIKSDTIF